MAYSKQTWADGQGGMTPLTPARLGHIEDGLEAAAAHSDTRARLHWVDVREHGAVLDGATNDTAAITAAVAALGSTPGVLYLPGFAVCDPDVVVLRTGQTLLGDGPGRSGLIQRAGTSGTALVATYNFASLTGTDTSAATPHGFGLIGITLDGNKAATTGTPRGVAVYGHSYLLRDVHVIGCRGAGIWSEWSTAGESDQGPMEAHLTGFKVLDCGGIGLDWHGPHDSAISDGEVARCAQTTGDYGVRVGDGTGDAVGTAFATVHVWGVASNYAWRIEDQATRFVDCVAEGSQLAQVWIHSAWVLWRGGHCYSADVNAATNVGFLMGSATMSPAACDIAARVDSCGGGAVDYAYGSINRFDLQVTYYPSDPPAEPSLGVIGALRPGDSIRVAATDGGDTNTSGSTLNQPGALVVHRSTAGDTRDLLDVRDETSTQLWRVAANGDMVVSGVSYLAAVQVFDRLTIAGANGLSGYQLCGRKTTPGAPTTGTWLTDDLVLDSAGAWHYCTAGGTPGTWT